MERTKTNWAKLPAKFVRQGSTATWQTRVPVTTQHRRIAPRGTIALLEQCTRFNIRAQLGHSTTVPNAATCRNALRARLGITVMLRDWLHPQACAAPVIIAAGVPQLPVRRTATVMFVVVELIVQLAAQHRSNALPVRSLHTMLQRAWPTVKTAQPDIIAVVSGCVSRLASVALDIIAQMVKVYRPLRSTFVRLVSSVLLGQQRINKHRQAIMLPRVANLQHNRVPSGIIATPACRAPPTWERRQAYSWTPEITRCHETARLAITVPWEQAFNTNSPVHPGLLDRQ
eukprot:TRINITY_DN205_c0_g1_i4.p2 TRINITY_DN205_c0_g1~~TRINITY_DN205_c0_g1_i4.p2  ORF type:complete len:286 (+),score=22.63 TRINITY_DN205_c0_g1_i4:5704-6561(+)